MRGVSETPELTARRLRRSKLLVDKLGQNLQKKLDPNILKFKAASDFCRERSGVSFHLFVVGKTVEHYKDPINSERFSSRYLLTKKKATA